MYDVRPFLLPGTLLMTVFVVKVSYVHEPNTSESFALASPEIVHVSDVDVLRAIRPLLATRSVDRTARYLKQDDIPFEQKLRLLRRIAADATTGLTNEDIAQLILDVANGFTRFSDEQKQFFQLFITYPDILKNTEPLYLAVQNDYNETVLPLQDWAAEIMDRYPSLKKELLELKFHALKRAADDEDLASFQKEVARKGIFPGDATELLWYIVSTGKGAVLIPELQRLQARIDDKRDGVTPLIRAVQIRFVPAVKALLAAGADPNLFVDPAVGSALQQAISLAYDAKDPRIKKAYQSIELLLRKSGARE